MGEHGLIQKWATYDCVTRAPLIARLPKDFPSDRRIDDLCQLFDLVNDSAEVHDHWHDTV